MAKFELFRLSLFERKQPDLFNEQTYDRKTFIKRIFSESFQFEHRSSEFHYVPLTGNQDDLLEDKSDFVVGQIGRGLLTHENAPPEQGFKDTTRTAWSAAPIVIDPTDHRDGQKLSMQYKNTVGDCGAILKSLVNNLNSAHEKARFGIDIEKLLDDSSFWKFAELHKGEIKKLTFDFVAPNMFGGSDEFEEDLRELRDKERARKLTVQWSNPDGLNTDTETTRQAVSRAKLGKGTIKASTKEGKTFNSESKGAKVDVPENQIDKTSLKQSLLVLAKRILGRE